MDNHSIHNGLGLSSLSNLNIQEAEYPFSLENQDIKKPIDQAPLHVQHDIEKNALPQQKVAQQEYAPIPDGPQDRLNKMKEAADQMMQCSVKYMRRHDVQKQALNDIYQQVIVQDALSENPYFNFPNIEIRDVKNPQSLMENLLIFINIFLLQATANQLGQEAVQSGFRIMEEIYQHFEYFLNDLPDDQLTDQQQHQRGALLAIFIRVGESVHKFNQKQNLEVQIVCKNIDDLNHKLESSWNDFFEGFQENQNAVNWINDALVNDHLMNKMKKMHKSLAEVIRGHFENIKKMQKELAEVIRGHFEKKAQVNLSNELDNMIASYVSNY